MKLFFKKLALLTLVFAIFAGIVNIAFILVKGSLVPAYVDRFLDAPAQIQVANLGNSHGQSGFVYSDHKELLSANFAFGSQSLEHDERLLEYYIDRFTEGSVLYVPVSYSSLFGDTATRSDFLSLNRRYYYILPPNLMLNFSWREWLSVKLPGLFISNWLSEYWKVDEFEEAAVMTAENMDVQADAQYAVERHILQFQKNGAYEYNPIMIENLEKIVALCKDHNVTPVLVTTPFLREYNDLVPADFLAKQLKFLNDFAAEHGIEYLDYSRDSRFIDRYDLFINSDHMNENGGLLFTNLLLDNEKPLF